MTTTATIIANLQDEVAELQRQLAAAQAVIAKLRDAIDDKQWAKDGDVHAHNFRVQQALAITADNTPMRQLLEAQREAAAKVCDDFHVNEYNFMPQQCAAAIRAMPLVIDEARK